MQTMNTKYAPAKIVLYDGDGTKEIYNDGGRIKHISIRTNSYDGNVVGIGGVYSPQCTVIIQEEAGIELGTAFELYYEISGEWKNEGVFFVNDEPEYSGGDMSFTAGGILERYRNVIFEFEDFYRTNRTTTVKDVVAKVNEILGLDVSKKINIPSADFGKWEISCPLRQTQGNNYLPSLGGESKITIGELLAGLAVMYGGNVIERDGAIYLSSVFSALGVEAFDISDCFPGFSLSKRSYALQMIKVSSIPSVKKQADYPELGLMDMEWLVYSGTSRMSRAIYRKEKDQINSDITYTQSVECDWAGTYVYADDGSPVGPIFSETYSQGNMPYHTGELSFAGINKDLQAGEIIQLRIDEDTTIPFMIGEVSLEWDGGFTTTISCDFGIDASSGEHKSQTTSSYESEQNATSGMVQRNNAVYADTILSNVARISELFAKTLTADEAFIGELTANKAFIEELTASTAFIEDLKANAITTEYIKSATAEIGYLTAEEADLGYAKIDLANIKEASITDAMIRNATIGFEKVNRSFIGNLTVSTEFVNAIRGITASFGYLDADKADLRYANITFGNIDTANIDVAEVANLFTQVGIIDRATISNGKITGTLDAVNVKIDAGSISMGTLDCGTIDVTNLKAASITVGQINGYQIAPGAIDMSNLSQAVTGQIGAAQATADSKNTIFYQTTAPPGTHKVNDVWFDTDDANKMYGWNGTSWSDKQFGTNAISDAAITNAKISNLDAGKITTGYLSAQRIAANTIQSAMISSGAVTSAKISSGAVTTDKLSVGTGGNIYATGYDMFEQITNQTLQYAITGASATIDTSRHYIGTRCLKISSTNASNYTYLGYSGNGYGCVPVVSGKTYIVSAYMMSSTPLTAKMYAIGHESIDSVNRVVSGQGSFSVGTSWSRVFFRFTASSSYPYISIRIDGGGNGTTLWVDAIQIETGTASQSPSDFKPAGTTLISGGRIITNSITAAQIDVNNLFAQNITASGSITGAKLYGTYAEITNGKVGIFSITQYALTYESADYKSTLDRAGLTLGLKYGGSSALNNYSTYKASGITCRYQEGGDYVFRVDTNKTGALLIDNVIAPETAHSGTVGTLSKPFGTGYFDTVRGGSTGNLTLTAPGGQVFMGGGAIRPSADIYPQSNNTCRIGWPTYRFLEVNATTVNATKFAISTGTLTPVSCTIQESFLYKIGNIVFMHVVFTSTRTENGGYEFIKFPNGYAPKSTQHDNILANNGKYVVAILKTNGSLQIDWASGMGGIRYTTCYVAA